MKVIDCYLVIVVYFMIILRLLACIFLMFLIVIIGISDGLGGNCLFWGWWRIWVRDGVLGMIECELWQNRVFISGNNEEYIEKNDKKVLKNNKNKFTNNPHPHHLPNPPQITCPTSKTSPNKLTLKYVLNWLYKIDSIFFKQWLYNTL